MILKKADHRGDLRTLRSLENRHPDRRSSIVAMIRGVEGEMSTAHYLDRDFGRDDDFVVLHDVRIGIGRDLAQNDHVVVDRSTGTVWLLETKNFGGTLSWNARGDWTVTYPSGPVAIESPVAQARRHRVAVLDWLRRQDVQPVHVRCAVLIEARTLLSRGTEADDVPVMKADEFPRWLRMDRLSHMVSPGSRSTTMEEARDLGRRMAAAHVPMPDWKTRLSLPDRQPEGTNADRRTGTTTRRSRMPRHRRSTFDDLMHIATRSQTGALSVGAIGLALASPLPHAVLDMVSSKGASDDPYVAMSAGGAIGAFYLMIPVVRCLGFLLVALTVVILLAKGREIAYRRHLDSTAANAAGAATLAVLAVVMATIDPPRFVPGTREMDEAADVALGRGATGPVARATDRTRGETAVADGSFPASGTVRWGDEQPIGGNLAQLDVWDATQSPQDKVVNVRSALVMTMPGVRTAPYATIYVRAGQRATVRLPADRPWRITAMAGDRWTGGDALFGPDATVVDFGTVTLTAHEPQAVVMGAEDQNATVVPASRF